MRLLEHLDLGQDLLVAALRGPALARDALLDAREVGEHELELERGEIAFGIGRRPRRRRTRAARSRIASQLRRAPRTLAPRPSPGFEPGGRARWTSSKPAATVFFDFDISVSAPQPLVGQARDADRGLVLAGDRQPGERAEQAVRARAGESDETEVLHRGAGYRSASLQLPMSKKTKKRRLKARRNKANHGKRPRAGR